MKTILKLSLIVFCVIYLSACNSTTSDNQENNTQINQTEITPTDSETESKEEKYGAEITVENAIAVSEIPALLAK